MVSHQHGGPFVDDSERFHHMLFFAVWIRRNARSIFEVELPMPHRRGAFEGFAHRGKARGNASVFPQESMNSAGRFWQPQLPSFQGSMPIQIIENDLWTRRAAQSFWRII